MKFLVAKTDPKKCKDFVKILFATKWCDCSNKVFQYTFKGKNTDTVFNTVKRIKVLKNVYILDIPNRNSFFSLNGSLIASPVKIILDKFYLGKYCRWVKLPLVRAYWEKITWVSLSWVKLPWVL